MSNRLRFATYNIHGCVGSDGRYDPARVAGVIRSLKADIVGLQEVDGRRPAHQDRDQLDYLSHETGMRAEAGPTLHDELGNYGNALLTRLEVSKVRRHDLSVEGYEPRGAIDADLRFGDGLLRVVVTHLGRRSSERSLQLGRLLDHLDSHDSRRPLVLLGDFNEWLPWTSRLARLGRRFAYSHSPRSFPSFLPVLSLDRICANPRPDHAAVRVPRRASTLLASDHLPVAVNLAWIHDKTTATCP